MRPRGQLRSAGLSRTELDLNETALDGTKVATNAFHSVLRWIDKTQTAAAWSQRPSPSWVGVGAAAFPVIWVGWRALPRTSVSSRRLAAELEVRVKGTTEVKVSGRRWSPVQTAGYPSGALPAELLTLSGRTSV